MARKSKLSDGFAIAVELALEHYAEPAWLGTESPLAAPYFLGNSLGNLPQANTPAGRGNVLRTVLRENAERLSAQQQQMLNVSYFERKHNLNNIGIALQLGMAEKTYYRHQKAAIEALADVLNEHVSPPMRTELPRARPIVGRTATLSASWAALRENETVTITGMSGIGKTALGAALANQWQAGRVFWFTVRPGLTDQLSSFVFSLGFFLRELGVSNTWRQLIADRGTLNVAHILGLLRNDLGSIHDPPILLCVDEVHLLRSELNDHAQLTHLLEDLCALTPLLLIGQQSQFQSNRNYTLTGLTVDEITELFKLEQLLDVPAVEREQLHRATRGNPALIRLCLVLCRMGEPLQDAIAQLTLAPSVETLFNRIWKGLDGEERWMLMALSVFRTAAPGDAWPSQSKALNNLIERDVVQADERGGVAVLPFLREVAYQRITAELKVDLHLAAGRIRETRGEYMSAAYHYIAAHHPALAIWVWFNHRQTEIARGRGPAANAMFRDIPPVELAHNDDRRALALLRAELLKLTGSAEEALDVIDRASWPETHPATPYAQQLRGDFMELKGEVDQALARYRDALRGYTNAPERQIVHLHTRIGYVHLFRTREPEVARQDAIWSMWRAETFMGNVEEETGNYQAAQVHYQAALELTPQLDDVLEARSLTFEHLGRLAWRRGDAVTAISFLKQAISHARERGDTLGVVYNQATLSAALIEDEQYESGLDEACAGLSAAESLAHAYLISALAVNAGDACIYLNRHAEAEQYAERILQEEETIFRPHAMQLLGRVRRAQKRWSDAEAYLKDAIRLARATRDKGIESFAWNILGHVYAEQNNRSDALSAFKQAKQMYSELGMTGTKETKELDMALAALGL